MRATLTRRVVFAAAHRYRRPDWDDAKNREVFGACANPNYHGHNYAVDVTVRTPTRAIDPVTGFAVDLTTLDGVLEREVMQPLDHKNLNLQVPEFADGRLIPTSENIAAWILQRVQRALGDAVQVVRVRVTEDHNLSAEVEP